MLGGIGWLSRRRQQARWDAARAQGLRYGLSQLDVLHHAKSTARPVHGADVAVIVTNGRVTGPAVNFPKQQRLHVVDRRTLAAWASGARPLWELLRAVPPRDGPPL
ncbi:hypothetical protein ACFZCT_31000 [Streptomyces qaidamensis]|uniref:hypothetical protein n=1 Tax=Streptomyces qaidamensis TaxID=1783515 RepID=UPI0036ED1CC2